MTTAALVLASVALVLAIAAIIVGGLTMRQSADTTSKIRRHRIAHQRAEGAADPVPDDDGPLNLGPPRGAHRYAPPTGTMPAVLVDHPEPLTREQADQLRADDTLPPGALDEQHDGEPTVESPAARPRPLPGQP